MKREHLLKWLINIPMLFDTIKATCLLLLQKHKTNIYIIQNYIIVKNIEGFIYTMM